MRHACVFADEDDADAARAEVIGEAAGHLFRQALLQLQAAREEVDDTRELRQTENAFPRHVADVSHATEGEQVVLTHGHERDVPGEDELVVLLVIGERRE